MKATAEQITAWKQQYGQVYEIVIEGKRCYLHQPTRQVLSLAMAKAQTNPLAFAETLVENCWLDGDAIIKTDDGYFLGLSAQLDALIQVKTATLKKL